MTLTARKCVTWSSAAIGLALTIGCNGLPDGNSAKTVAGTYHATTLRLSDTANATFDALITGGGFTVVLTADGTIQSGHVSIPFNSLSNALNADFTGTFDVLDPSVRFHTTNGVFVDNLLWTYSFNTLQATGSNIPQTGLTLTVILAR